jgi:hypothetical protein
LVPGGGAGILKGSIKGSIYPDHFGNKDREGREFVGVVLIELEGIRAAGKVRSRGRGTRDDRGRAFNLRVRVDFALLSFGLVTGMVFRPGVSGRGHGRVAIGVLVLRAWCWRRGGERKRGRRMWVKD